MNSIRCRQCKHFIIANAGEGKIYGCDRSKCVFEPTTKNDLGVDWENYKDADGNCLDDLILEVLQNNFDCGNTYGYKVADEIIELLPSVTPQPCEDAISRKAVINQIFYSTDNNGDVVLGSALRERIARLPSVTSQEPKTGHWISTETKGVRYAFWCRYKCSLCGGLSARTNFCPNCGARMVEPQESESE